jgi:hypothetical protein
VPEQFSRPVAASARAKLNLADAKLRPEHFYASLPLCVIDAVCIETFVDMEDAEKVDLAETLVRRLPGQASGISFDNFALLGGHQVVKADRMICRFVAEAAGSETVTPKIAKEALFGGTAILQSEFPHVDTRLLDSEVWKYESERTAARRKRPLETE